MGAAVVIEPTLRAYETRQNKPVLAYCYMVQREGFEPPLPAKGWRNKHYTISTKWVQEKDSNQRPSGYEPDELTTAPPCINYLYCNIQYFMGLSTFFVPVKKYINVRQLIICNFIPTLIICEIIILSSSFF
jgi:hypothetical protein